MAGTVILTWRKARCEEDISHYRIYRNGVVIANTFKDEGSLTLNNQPLGVLLRYRILAVTKDGPKTPPFRTQWESDEIEVTLPGDGTITLEDRLLNNFTLNFYL